MALSPKEKKELQQRFEKQLLPEFVLRNGELVHHEVNKSELL